MGGTSRTPLAVRTGAQAVVAALLGSAALTAARAASGTAASSWGEQALLAWVCALIAGAAALGCAYLALVWTLATVVMAWGPRGAIGGASLRALRLLAPALARRTAATALIASTLASVPLAAAHADDGSSRSAPRSATAAARLLHTEAGTDIPVTGAGRAEAARMSARASFGSLAAAPGPRAEQPADPSGADFAAADPPVADPPAADGADASEPPPLGWGESPADPTPPTTGTTAPAAESAAPEVEGTAPAVEGTSSAMESASPVPESTSPAADSASPTPESAGPQPLVVVEVRQGDTLWSITDDLLGPGPDDPAAIASAWPTLWEANASVIGSDPNALTPDQQLVVPTPLAPRPSPAAPLPSQEES